MPDSPARGIFISYRRAETSPYARLLQLQLSGHFPNAPVFVDLDSIEAGLDFADVIRAEIHACGVMLALIGPAWATVADDAGRRRLEDPADYVRFEISTALRRPGLRVIPVLVDGARPVQRTELPYGLRRLARLSALEMSCDHHYYYDTSRLVDTIANALTQPPVPVAGHQPSAPDRLRPRAAHAMPSRGPGAARAR